MPKSREEIGWSLYTKSENATSQLYERGSTLIISNLPFQEWTEVLGSERLIGTLLDRITHHMHILETTPRATVLGRAVANEPHPQNTESYPSEREAG